MLVVNKTQQVNNQLVGKRRATGKDKGKKSEAFGRVLDEKLQVTADKPTQN